MTPSRTSLKQHLDTDAIWNATCDETSRVVSSEPVLASFLHATILHHDELERLLHRQSADSPTASSMLLRKSFWKPSDDLSVIRFAMTPPQCLSVIRHAAITRYLFCTSKVVPRHRVAHRFEPERTSLALYKEMSQKFGVDIHPAAQVGRGVMLDHGTGLVVGETAVIGNQVSFCNQSHWGHWKTRGDRHPLVTVF